jgi:hypothetical protein
LNRSLWEAKKKKKASLENARRFSKLAKISFLAGKAHDWLEGFGGWAVTKESI